MKENFSFTLFCFPLSGNSPLTGLSQKEMDSNGVIFSFPRPFWQLHADAAGERLAEDFMSAFPSPILISGVRNYLKEALVNIIAVHAEVSCH